MEKCLIAETPNLNLYSLEKETDKDHVATPRWVVEQIYSIVEIENYQMCWFPFNNYDSQFKLKADELKIRYKATHIFDDLGNDFFKTEPPPGCDLMISNPPFGQQNKIIDRSFELVDTGRIKAFALLLPLSTLETPNRADVWQKHEKNLSIIIFKKRIKFLGKKTTFNTACCWMLFNIEAVKEKILWI